MSNSLWPYGLQHTRPPCPQPTPRVYSNSCPLSQWCYPVIPSSVIPFSSCLQSFPASGSFPMSQFFTSGSQSIGASASASALPMNIQDWFPLGLTGTLKSLLQYHSSKASILLYSAFLIVQFSHPYMTTGEIIALTRWTELQYNFIIPTAFIQQSANSKLQNNFKEQDNKHVLFFQAIHTLLWLFSIAIITQKEPWTIHK